MTQCIDNRLNFQPLANKQITGEFSALNVSSDAGALLLREVERSRKILQRFSQCFQDYRNPELIDMLWKQYPEAISELSPGNFSSVSSLR
jgi:hypothetical protein